MTSSASVGDIRGRMEGSERASRVLPEPGGPLIKNVVSAGCRHLQRPLDMFLPFHILIIGDVGGRIGVQVQVSMVRLDRVVVAEVGDQPPQGVHRVDVDTFHQRGLGRIGLRHVNSLVALLASQVRHRQYTLDVAHGAVQRELTDEDRTIQVRRQLPG